MGMDAETTMSEENQERYRTIVGVRFKERGKVYNYDAGDIPLRKMDQVVVIMEERVAVGTVVAEMRIGDDRPLPPKLKKVERRATDDDIATAAHNRRQEDEAHVFCAERIKERGLPMKLVDVECLFDRSKIIIFFIADNRVDFRELVKDLVQKYKTRIELKQIWVRSEARMCGGIGICGRELCCVSFLNNFAPVSIKMAKEQNMLLNPEKISGLCGRLMCCLSYEHEFYSEHKKDMPKCGKFVETPKGRGKVVRQDVLGGKYYVSLEDGNEVEIAIDDPRGPKGDTGNSEESVK